MTNNDLQNITQKNKGRGTRTTLSKSVSELDCSRRVNLAFILGLLHTDRESATIYFFRYNLHRLFFILQIVYN